MQIKYLSISNLQLLGRVEVTNTEVDYITSDIRIYIYKNSSFIGVTNPTFSSNIYSFNFTLDSIEEGDIIICRVKYNYVFHEYSKPLIYLIEKDNTFFNHSNLSKFLSPLDTDIENWTENLLKKLQTSELLPKYIIDNINDDYYSFWRSILNFLSLFVNYSKKINEGILNDSFILILKHLESRGIFIKNNSSKSELIELRKNFYSLLLKRSSLTSDEEIRNYLLLNDESFVKVLNPNNFGWIINKTSPNFRKTSLPPIDLELLETTNQSLVIEGDLIVSTNSYLGTLTDSSIKCIQISEFIDYEVSFFIKRTEENSLFSFGVQCFDESKHLLKDTKCVYNGVETDWFLQNQSIITDSYYFVRGILFNSFKEIQVSDRLDFNGHSLIMPKGTKYFNIYITTNNLVKCKDFKIEPILPTKGYIGSNNLIELSFENKFNKSEDEIRYILQRYLLPYQLRVVLNLINNDSRIDKLPCQHENISPNYIETGIEKCEKSNGINTGRYFIQKKDLNICTNKGVKWFLSEEYDFKKCKKCLTTTGIELYLSDSISCKPNSIDFDSISCKPNSIDFDSISCCSTTQKIIQEIDITCRETNFITTVSFSC